MLPKVILISMVKNEEKILERLMSSVLSHIDGYFICDTGSTDNTVSIANEFIKKHNKDGKVVQIDWVNFGVSRSESAKKAYEWVKEMGWESSKTWGLLLDGDMILPDPIDKNKLDKVTADSILLNQKNSSIIYKNTRLLRLIKEWKCVGSTHEYWASDNSDTFDFPIIIDLNDGGCKSDKFERDKKFLKKELVDKPFDERALFYLGQTYQSLEKYKKSNEMLRRRIKVGGWIEELYMSHMYRGNNFNSLKKPEKAVYEWLKAWNKDNRRWEGALSAISYYRSLPDMQFIAMMYIEKLIEIQLGENLFGIQISKPIVNNCVLFIDYSGMKYDIWKEFAVLAFYTKHTKEAYVRLDEQTILSKHSFNEKNNLNGYKKWYEFILDGTCIKLEIDNKYLPWNKESDSEIWKPFNPSIRTKNNLYELVLRYANYSTNEAVLFPCRGRDPYIITRNLFCTMNSSFVINPIKELKYDSKYIKKESNIMGLEDFRLFQNSSLNMAFATGRQFTESNTNKMSIVNFSISDREAASTFGSDSHRSAASEGSGDSCLIIKNLELPLNTKEEDCQKNWLPFSHNKKSYFIFKIHPFIVCDIKSNIILKWESKSRFTLDGFKGSTAPVPFSPPMEAASEGGDCRSAACDPLHGRADTRSEGGESFIMIIHDTHHEQSGRRYYHRFLTLDKNFMPLRLSGGFRFSKERIEYISGMCKDLNTTSKYNITYGLKDSEAYLYSVDIKTIESILWYDLNSGKTDVHKRMDFILSVTQ